MIFEIESDIPLVKQIAPIICRRGRSSVAITRKFIAECGTKIIVNVGARGGILKMEPEYPCKAGKECDHCKDRMSKIRILIENEK
jgi:hypothetical protein